MRDASFDKKSLALILLNDLSTQNRAEMKVLGIDRVTLAAKLIRLAAVGYAEIAVDDEGWPMAAMGINKHPTEDYTDTWFICTRAFFAKGLEGIRYSRARLKEFRKVHGRPLRSTSYSPLAEAPKWFKALGFERMPDRVDGSKVFVYR